MNAPRILVRACALIILTATVGFPKTKSPPDVLVVADTSTKNADLIVRPAPGKPVYYLIMGMKEHDLGTINAGVRYPDPKVVRRELVNALAPQGYLETKLGGPMPAIVLVITWGQANLSTADQTEAVETDNPNNVEGPLEITTTYDFNTREMAQLVGLEKAGDKFMSDSEAIEINDLMNYDRLYITVGALDAKAWLKKEKKVLWRTHISIDALRDDLTDNLHLMINDAAPYFGRNEERAVKVNEATRRSGVKMGELIFLDDDPAPTGDAKK